MDQNIDEMREPHLDACQHVPALGWRVIECAKCGKRLFDYDDDSPEAWAAYKEARRRVEEGFK